jgi:D-alanyl-D-alanine carboxypeptidase/D-alanyl-D-alanine-endopeptidase (penicillin-binding protein 4)
MRRCMALLALLVLAVSACGTEITEAVPGGSTDDTEPSSSSELKEALLAIENQAKYKASDWGYIAIDQKTRDVLVAQNPDKMFDPGSTMKSFSVTAALKAYGDDFKMTTPVFRAGSLSGDTLNGNLILVGSGDLSFGLRAQPDGSLFYENMPVLDHSYANLGIPGAIEPPGDPLAVLDEFAQEVKAAGITRVNGDVVIDDRLFTPIQWPDGLVSPIWVNENLIDIEVSPGSAAGQPTTIADWRPKTASYTVETQATTVGANNPTQLFASEPTPGHIVVTGQIAAGFPTTLVAQEIADPSAFARTAFIEALQRAGVTVTAAPTGPNPAALLPPADSYQPGDKLAEHTSASLAAYVQLIMKISYNRGADLMTCLAAVKAGSTDCEQGLVAEVDNFTELGVSKDAVFPFDGAGSDDHNRASPRALATFYKNATGAPYAQALFDSLPILGKDGSLANIQPDSPAAGKAQLKTGNRAAGPPTTGQTILLGNSLAGYVEGKSGRRFTVMIAMGNMPFSTLAQFVAVTQDQAKMVTAMQQAF